MILKKLKKINYLKSKIYRPIALLDIFRKVLETVIVKHFNKIVKRNHLFPKHQMGGRKRRLIKIALKIIIDSVYIIWNQGKDNIISLLSLNIIGAFDNVSYKRLLHNLKIKGIFKGII